MEFGCEHYQRRCLLFAPCCQEAFWCRHCHNAAKHDDETDASKRHVLNRKAIKDVICAVCSLKQPVQESCQRCGVQFGRYFCKECRFYDDDVSKRQYHCDGCGICRVGGRENYFHCHTCKGCYHIDIQDDHVCIKDGMTLNCPVCQECMFESIQEITVLPCGHTIHVKCRKHMIQHEMHRCPICYRSMIDMTIKWRQMDRMVINQRPSSTDDIFADSHHTNAGRLSLSTRSDSVS